MTRKIFFDLVEIRTKLASFFPFLIAVLFTNTYFHLFHWGKTLFFFFGMIAFDMATTAINNYMDFRKAHSEEYKYQENIIGKAQLSKRTVVMIIFGLIGFSAIVGITLAIQTGWLLLVMGCACCFIGVFYTFGPIPLSRMPLGEVFSGVTMGLGIFAIMVYLNTYDKKLFFHGAGFATFCDYWEYNGGVGGCLGVNSINSHNRKHYVGEQSLRFGTGY